MKVKREERTEEASGEGALKSKLEKGRSAIAGGRPTTSLSDMISYEENEDEDEEDDWEDDREETQHTSSQIDSNKTGICCFINKLICLNTVYLVLTHYHHLWQVDYFPRKSKLTLRRLTNANANASKTGNDYG